MEETVQEPPGEDLELDEGIWSPGANKSDEKPLTNGFSEVPKVNGVSDIKSPPPPPPLPPQPIWSPKSKTPSPALDKKEFKPVPFESPKAARKITNPPQSKSGGVLPPWESKLAGSQSAPAGSTLSSLAGTIPPPPPPPPPSNSLPKAQNPTITLLQKAREGQLPRGAAYLQDKERDPPNDRRFSPPRAQSTETVYSLRRGYMSEPETEVTKMTDVVPKKYEGIGPTTREGMPISLRSEVKETNQSKWYKKMYDTIHKNKYDDDYVTVRYKSRKAHPSTIHTAPRNNSQYAYFDRKSGYLSEPEGGSRSTSGWLSDAYDSDAPSSYRRNTTLDRLKSANKENSIASDYLPSTKYSTLASAKASQEVYKNQPGRIEDYIPGRSSVVDKEAKQWWDEVMDIFDGQVANAARQQPINSKQSVSSSTLSKSYMARALKESGYESDSTLIFRRREADPPLLSPKEQKQAYREVQAGGEPPLHGFRKPAPDRPRDDTEIEYFPLSPTLTRIRVHKKTSGEKHHSGIQCYPITTTLDNPSALFQDYKQNLPSFIPWNFPKAPPAPPKRKSSKTNSTLKTVSNQKLRNSANIKYLQNKISSKLSVHDQPKENRRKIVQETKMKSPDGKRIRTTKTAVSVPTALTGKVKSSKPQKSAEKGTSSFSSPRRMLSPVDYNSQKFSRYSGEPQHINKVIVEGGVGRRTPISGILDRGRSLDRTFASEKKNLPLKNIKLSSKTLSKSSELISPAEVNKVLSKSSKFPPGTMVKKSTVFYSSSKSDGKYDKSLDISVTMSPKAKELLRSSEKLSSLDKQKSPSSSDISSHTYTTEPAQVQTKSKSTHFSRKLLEDIANKAKKSNESPNSAKVLPKNKISPKSSSLTRNSKSSKPESKNTDCKSIKSVVKKNGKRTKQESSSSSSKPSVKMNKEQVKSKEALIKSVNNQIDSFVSQYEKDHYFGEIFEKRNEVMSDSFFQHLLLRQIPPHSRFEYDPDYYNTEVLEKAKIFQNNKLNAISLPKHENSYLNTKKAVTESKFRSWDRSSVKKAPRAVSWPGRMTTTAIKKFDSLSLGRNQNIGSTLIFSQSRSRSEPPLDKIILSQTVRPKSPIVTSSTKVIDTPGKIVYKRTPSPPAKIIFSQTSRPVSPAVVHRKRKIEQEPEQNTVSESTGKIILTQTSRPVITNVSKKSHIIRSRSESPNLTYHKFSVYEQPRHNSTENYTSRIKIREQSPSPSPVRSPSCRRIHSARITQCKGSTNCMMNLRKKILRTQSASESESTLHQKPIERSSSCLDLDHIRSHLEYQDYITELRHRRGKSERFKELNRFYSYLERIGQLEKATSNTDLRPRKKGEEIIDFERWKKVRAKERAEEELDRLYKKVKTEQQEKDFLFLHNDPDNMRWCFEKDWNLRAKEKSVEDLKEHFSKMADDEFNYSAYKRKYEDISRDVYKPLWRGNSVVNVAANLGKKRESIQIDKGENNTDRIKAVTSSNSVRDRLGIGSRLWSSLSMEQVNALKVQLNSIYGKDFENKDKEDYVITVPNDDREKIKGCLQVRCNSFSAGENIIDESRKPTKSDSIGSIQHMDKELKNSINALQNLSEKDKKKISMTLGQEVMEKIRKSQDKYPPTILAKETRGAIAASRIQNIKNMYETESPRTCYSFDASEDGKSEPKNNLLLVLTPKTETEKLEDAKEQLEKIADKSYSPQRASSTSETETGSSDTSNRTVIFRGSKDDIQKKVEFFENNDKNKEIIPTIYVARDDSDEKFESLEAEIAKMESKKSVNEAAKNVSKSSSYTDLKDIFGETSKNNYNSLPTKIKTDKESQRKAGIGIDYILSNISSSENICRSRSLSPDPERYWRAYLSLVKAGAVGKLKKRFEFPESLSDLESDIPGLRRYQSDPEIVRTILQHNWKKKQIDNLKEYEKGDVDRLTHKYELKNSRGRTKSRKYGLSSPIPKMPLRIDNRDMPHIDVISKLASLKPLRSSDSPSKSITKEYPAECPIGEVSKIKEQFEKDKSTLKSAYTSVPDIRELRDISPYLSGSWTAHKYPKRQDNNRSHSSSEYISEDKCSPMRKDRRRPKSTSPIGSRNYKNDSIVKQAKRLGDIFADQEFDPAKHRPKYRYLPAREVVPPRPPCPSLPSMLSSGVLLKPSVTFKDPVAPTPPPKATHYDSDYSLESPRRYVESDVNIHYRVPVRQEPRPLVPEDELSRRQAEHMRQFYQEERRRKYLQELQDMNSRRHTDNFTPSQKSPIALNRYDSFGNRQIARALHNFVGQVARELSFRKGDLILVRRKIDENWYEGEHNSRVGLFPANYVEIVDYDGTIQKKSTEGRARAKYDFVAQTHLELGLRKGELVNLIRRVDSNWFEGRLGERKGIFPISYVEVLAEPQQNRAELPASLVSGKPVASPAAHSITSSAGAASLGAHHYTPQLNSPALSNSPSSTAPLPSYGISSHYARPVSATLPRATDPSPVNLNNHEPLFVDTNAEAVPYRAMYKYRPQNPDELELNEGDTVYVLEKCDDGWYVGSSQRTGRFGTFPGNYVEKI